MNEKRVTDPLRSAFEGDDTKNTARIYDGWAGEYENAMASSGYTHPAMVAGLLSRHQTPGEDDVLDAGCGTGIMSEILKGLGYGSIHGLDASEEMLARAREKGHYQSLTHQFLGEKLDYADDRFMAVVATGVFTQGHAPVEGFEELVRVTRPGGLIVFSISRVKLDQDFPPLRERLESEGLWEFVDSSAKYNSTPLTDTMIAQVYAFGVK